MLQAVKIERKTEEGRQNSVSHYILQQKALRKLKSVPFEKAKGFSVEEHVEILEDRILTISYEQLQKAIALPETQFVELIRHGGSLRV